ncbi:nitrite reductase [Nocardioides sp. Arc9.136]|uniref:nitrite reductase n=1 Tax=Nocardioides sp. Arc9.136 TaxID=2996826 RepID=UPI00266657E5|nr:nitrite reductase [Nocardioides sp. Arc9.136]WKN48897.1 nitrite reductase [Nocardioides sp. Arc9.136]
MDRYRPDRCPGVLRPWPAADGLLVRLRPAGGRLPASSLRALAAVAERYGDGRVHVTGRANLQVRALPAEPGTERLPADVLAGVEATGLLPSRAHDVARNLMASPQTGLAGGRADLRPVVDALDAELRADPRLASLPGRFLLVLDDRGDLADRSCDLGVVALDTERGQLRVGETWGPVVALADVPRLLADLARRFLEVRGDGPDAAWHVAELAPGVRLVEPQEPHPDLPPPAPALPYGAVPGGVHEPVPDEGLDRAAVERLCAAAPVLVVTPWRGVLIPEPIPEPIPEETR